MSALRQHVTDYLAMRRSLGFKLTFPGQVLPDFADYLDAAGASTVTTKLAIAWAGLPQGQVQATAVAIVQQTVSELTGTGEELAA